MRRKVGKYGAYGANAVESAAGLRDERTREVERLKPGRSPRADGDDRHRQGTRQEFSRVN